MAIFDGFNGPDSLKSQPLVALPIAPQHTTG